jgi:hypothetical protein
MRGERQGQTSHRQHALRLRSSLEMVAFPPLKVLRRVNRRLSFRSEIVQDLHAALGDHYDVGSVNSREAKKRGKGERRTGLDGSLQDIGDTSVDVELLLHARLDESGVG